MSSERLTPRADIYRVEGWSEGHFHVNAAGHVACGVDEGKLSIDLMDVVRRMTEEGIQVPAVIRFHDILRKRIVELNETFAAVIEDLNYKGRYCGVYPIKVNQMREVVEEIVEAARPYDFGMEAGSKAELLAVLAYNDNRRSLTIINGYKDDEFIRLALIGQKMGHRVFIVIENLGELQRTLRLAKELDVLPEIGVRLKISARGTGMWSESSGEQAKFGLALGDLMNGLALLKECKMEKCLKLLHFHLGSQVGDINHFRDALSEATRVYCELHRLGAGMEFLDVGGGLAIDYDGTRSTGASSCNYSLEEYAMAVVSQVQDICVEVGVPQPGIVSESGRFVTAHHSCIVTEVMEVISPRLELRYHLPPVLPESIHYMKMQRAVERIGEGALQSVFHELVALKEEVVSSFRLGAVGLEELTQVEELYWLGMQKLKLEMSSLSEVPEELVELERLSKSQYLCNFSVFQSAADSWAIGQLLPIVPLHRHHEEPTVTCSVADITCDSDGKIDKFIHGSEHNCYLKLHPKKDSEPYYLGVFLTGAYQDVMGDNHNLFGRLNEVHVYSDPSVGGDFFIEEVIPGPSKGEVLSSMQYHASVMSEKVMGQLNLRVQRGELSHREAKSILRVYDQSLRSYTYLEASSCPES